MDVDFNVAVALVGALLLVTSGLSGWLLGNVLSITVLAVGAGVALALANVIAVEPDSPGLIEVVELALVLTLFTDGLTVEQELLRERWRDPVRALVVAMPLTLVLTALAAKAIFPSLGWLEVLLLGAVLAPTDPVVTSTVVTSARVPVKVRHALNLESGLNDGLALPLVLVLLVAAGSEGGAGSEALLTTLESVAGGAIGAALAYAAGYLFARLPGGGLRDRYQGVYALAVPLLAYGIAEATIGNGLIATFVSGIVLAIRIPNVPDAFPEFNENLGSILQVVTFVLFGALVVSVGEGSDALAVAALVAVLLLVARPLAIAVSYARSGFSRPEMAFIAWFGPKGVASMLFALFVLESGIPASRTLFEIISYVILASILAHGLTDTLGARWVERKLQAAENPD
ncbi:MAG: cation:proton antiporter [Solirubrobacteraceae bacterium]